MPRRFVPKRGDLVWLQFNPQAGHEQAGRRPALVISPKAYHEKVGLGLFCPVTEHVKGYPFEVVLPHDLKVTGAILSDQIKCLDWRVRQEKYGSVDLPPFSVPRLMRVRVRQSTLCFLQDCAEPRLHLKWKSGCPGDVSSGRIGNL